MFQLWKHPNGIYYVLYGPRLKKRISTRESGRAKADIFLSQFIAGYQNPGLEAPTVSEILAAYVADKKENARSPKSMAGSAAAIDKKLGNLLPDHLTPAVIKRFALERDASAGTILRDIGVLRAALKWAEDNRLIERKPVIHNPVKAPKPRERWLTREEAKKLIAGCREPHIKLFVILGLMTVPRMGALLEAKWKQIDWRRKIIDYGEGHGNKRRAIVPLNKNALAALKAAKELACSDYIVEFRGEKIKTVKNGFKAACRRAGIEGVTPHILRHSGATWMAEDGVPITEIAKMLGDSIATTERVYAKHTPEFLKRASRALQM